MQRLPENWITQIAAYLQMRKTGKLKQRLGAWLLLFSCTSTSIGLTTTIVKAQSDRDLKRQEDTLIQEFTLPKAPTRAPVYRPQPTRQPSAAEKSAPRRTQKATRSNVAPRVQESEPEEAAAPQPSRPRSRRIVPQRQIQPRQRRRVEQPDIVPDEPLEDVQELETPTTARVTETTDKTPASQYILEFNRSPVVGDRLRLRGIYSEARLAFTRPRDWKMQTAKVVLRFQHSPALFANRSNLTLRVNGTSVGSVPLNRKQSQVGQVAFNIPPNLIRDYNDVSIVAQQNNSPTCSDPGDQTLWTEILPDSKFIFSFKPQAVPLNFSRYPYPFVDDLGLDAAQIVYLMPREMNEAWLTAASRHSASLGQVADFRPLDTKVVKSIAQVKSNQRLIVIGTPEEQPALRTLKLPFAIASNQILDGSRNPLPSDVGVLILATTRAGGVPVLVATGNGPEGVAKAVQSLVQSQSSKIGTGAAILVSKLSEIPTPPPRQWSRSLPEQNSFKLSDLPSKDDKPFEDITVRGAGAPPIEFDFRALPDDRFNRGSSMALRYSYGPQVNPRTSAIEVFLDGVFIGGARLTSEEGETRKTLNVNLPENLIKPTSKIQVAFRMNPREPADKCTGRLTDQQLSGTVHADTSFNLKREVSVQLPDLKLMQVGYPFASPQDLSNTAIVLPDSPSPTDLLTLLELSKRLGRLAHADTVKLKVYTTSTFPAAERAGFNIIAIGTRDKFPFPEALESGGFSLKDVFARQLKEGQIQTLSDEEGVIKQVISPWNRDRVLLALSAQTDAGLDRVRQVLSKDPWFFQLRDDTVLIGPSDQDAERYDPDAYDLKFLATVDKRRIENVSLLSQASHVLQENWVLLPIGILGAAFLLYGVFQGYLNRIQDSTEKK